MKTEKMTENEENEKKEQLRKCNSLMESMDMALEKHISIHGYDSCNPTILLEVHTKCYIRILSLLLKYGKEPRFLMEEAVNVLYKTIQESLCDKPIYKIVKIKGK